MVVASVCFCFCLLIGLFFFAIPTIGFVTGLIIIAVFGVPFAFAIVYFVQSGKEEKIMEEADLYQVPISSVTASAPTPDYLEKLKELKPLLDSGALAQEEFDREKQKLLG
jgi:ABC-type multidrug transport system permease subunit